MAAASAQKDPLWPGISEARKAAILAAGNPAGSLAHLEYFKLWDGEREIPGPRHNPLIVALGKAGEITWWNNDDDAYCAAVLNGVIVVAGGISTKSALARSFAENGYGTTLAYPVPGAIFVQPRNGIDSIFGHTGLVDHVSADGKRMTVINANVQNMIKFSTYPVSSALPGGFIWPEGIPMTEAARAAAEAYRKGKGRPTAIGAPADASVRLRALLVTGMSGEDVRELQRRLARLGIKPALSGTGYYGIKTEEAVTNFQIANGSLDVDGDAGPATQRAIEVALEAHETKAAQERAVAKSAAPITTAGAAGAGAVISVVNEAKGTLDTFGSMAATVGPLGEIAVAAVLAAGIAVVAYLVWRKVRGRRVTEAPA
ncbi:peptidoglycan-binding protein [Acuticoccus sp. M5D2P5]|uniref:C40 family peptidase n=1 Tax=Acuticoccus kalidii TaxID=2910977 RepID=UPI001F28E4C0|nr:peptidoglycan-binding protein [Acuticoccus kalidii]MCF3934990.1 peptidoglycan-binding protein [Acuticoccus kalidii]